MNRPKPAALRRPSAAKPSGLSTTHLKLYILSAVCQFYCVSSWPIPSSFYSGHVFYYCWQSSGDQKNYKYTQVNIIYCHPPQVTLPLEISLPSEQKAGGSPRHLPSFWSQRPRVPPPIANERRPPLCPPPPDCRASPSGPSSPPRPQSAPLEGLRRSPLSTRGPYPPPLRNPRSYPLKVCAFCVYSLGTVKGVTWTLLSINTRMHIYMNHHSFSGLYLKAEVLMMTKHNLRL